MRVVVRVRIFLTRHRWAYWVVVVAIAATMGWVVQQQVASLERTRASWGETRSVLVASGDLIPDGALIVSPVDVPIAMIPSGAISELPAGARVHQRVNGGEMLTTADLVVGPGPSAHAEPGTIVVGVLDPFAPDASVGLVVQVTSEGVVIAPSATIVAIVADVIFVAVDEADGPTVAAAAQSGLASVLFVP